MLCIYVFNVFSHLMHSLGVWNIVLTAFKPNKKYLDSDDHHVAVKCPSVFLLPLKFWKR